MSLSSLLRMISDHSNMKKTWLIKTKRGLSHDQPGWRLSGLRASRIQGLSKYFIREAPIGSIFSLDNDDDYNWGCGFRGGGAEEKWERLAMGGAPSRWSAITSPKHVNQSQQWHLKWCPFFRASPLQQIGYFCRFDLWWYELGGCCRENKCHHYPTIARERA